MIVFDKQKEIYYSTKINDKQYFSAFGTRTLKATDDNNSIKEFCSQNNLKVNHIYRPDQVHSSTIIFVDKENKEIEEGDGVITQERNTVIGVRTADCVPIVYVEKKTGTIAVSHQGWRGTIADMAMQMVEKMIVKGANPNGVIAAIGPSIGLCCYEVKEDVFSQFKERFAYIIEEVSIVKDGAFYINLLKLNYLSLIKAGVDKENIDYFPFCTFCNQQFFSYRRDYHTNYKNFGQQLSFIKKQYAD